MERVNISGNLDGKFLLHYENYTRNKQRDISPGPNPGAKCNPNTCPGIQQPTIIILPSFALNCTITTNSPGEASLPLGPRQFQFSVGKKSCQEQLKGRPACNMVDYKNSSTDQ